MAINQPPVGINILKPVAVNDWMLRKYEILSREISELQC